MEFVFATGNQHKVDEVQAMLPQSIKIISLKDLGFDGELPETQPTIEGNAKQKAEYLFHQGEEFVFAEDTGLEIEALNGEPGVKSARYAGEAKKSEDNMQLVLANLKEITNRKARFKTVVALFYKSKLHCFEGILNGTIIDEPRGTSGFGYDPIFVPEGSDKTLAEISKEEKGAISHRGKAVEKLVAFLKEQQP